MDIIRSIQNRIYEIRGERVILDFDLSFLYEVETRVMNQAVKRNIQRFPPDFMFQLTKQEYEILRRQIEPAGLISQIVISNLSTDKPVRGGTRKLPYAFTEQGVAMLSGVLNSDRAIRMNIAIMRAFVDIKRLALQQGDITKQLKAIQQRIGEHDIQLSAIYDAIENLLDENAVQRKWDNRQRIGFRK